MIKIEKDKSGNIVSESIRILTACLEAAIRRFSPSRVPEGAVPGEWEPDGLAVRNTMVDADSGEPCGATAEAELSEDGTLLSVRIDAPGSDTVQWKPSPMDEYVVTHGTDQEEDPPYESSDADTTVDDFLDSLFGGSLGKFVAHKSLVIRTEAMLNSVEFNLHSMLGASVIDAMGRHGSEAVEFDRDGTRWRVELRDTPPDLFIPEGVRDIILVDTGSGEPTDFFSAPTDLMFSACAAALRVAENG